ncbi:MAG: hypothetical protein K6G28_06670 [Acholeplasmatales bacterium]|nr:hypothetical protein [Acholeplasmatales bacterium]
MKIKITNFKVSLKNRNKDLKTLISNEYRFDKEYILDVFVAKESVDARHKNNITISYNLIVNINSNKFYLLEGNKSIEIYNEEEVKLTYPKWKYNDRPIIVGFGPAGIFASLYLARCGAKPIIIERGSDMDNRIKDVENFINNKELNINSNIQFGEGGAGTFSDGKLTTNVKDKLLTFIIQEFVHYGAPKEILYESLPHIGTDYLRKVIKAMREDMKTLGAEFYFNTKFDSFFETDDSVMVKTTGNNNLILSTSHLVLGLGHSARDTLKMLYSKNITMEPKAFSMGVRIEHKREKINNIQYGKASDILPPASYKLVAHLDNNRTCYSFCMCPGGEVMASTSEKNSIVTNGMSYHKRDLENSNAALLVNVDPSDYMKNSVLDGLDYQEYYERKAFEISNDYKAPINLVKEFLNNEVATSVRSVKPSYPMGYKFADLSECLPDYIIESLRKAIPMFDKKMNGYNDPDAVLTGIESRSSCPVRILRNEDRVSNNKYIYPIGEGAGYAGGISSAALDGLKTALKICGVDER